MQYHFCFTAIVVTGLVVLVGTLTGPIAAERWEPPDGIFPILGWVNPAPERYPEMAQAGFTIAHSVGADRLDIIHQAGMKALAGLGVPDTKEATQGSVKARMDYPAVIGYHLKDEPDASLFGRLAEVKHWGSQVAPKSLYFVNLYPNIANSRLLGTDTYEEYVDQYMQIFQPKVLCFDHYPLINENDCRPEYYQNLETIRAAAVKYDVPFWAFALVTPCWSYRDPTEGEIRFQIFSNLVYGAQGLFYFCYRQPSDDPFMSGVVDQESNPTHHYSQVKRINAMVHAWAPTLLKLRSTGVYHVGELPQGTRPLPADSLVRSVNPHEQLIIGLFDHIGGGQYVMLMNKDFRKARRFVVKFAPAVAAIQELSRRSGELLEPTPLPDSGTELYIAAGGAKLFVIQ